MVIPADLITSHRAWTRMSDFVDTLLLQQSTPTFIMSPSNFTRMALSKDMDLKLNMAYTHQVKHSVVSKLHTLAQFRQYVDKTMLAYREWWNSYGKEVYIMYHMPAQFPVYMLQWMWVRSLSVAMESPWRSWRFLPLGSFIHLTSQAKFPILIIFQTTSAVWMYICNIGQMQNIYGEGTSLTANIELSGISSGIGELKAQPLTHEEWQLYKKPCDSVEWISVLLSKRYRFSLQ